jgi:GNAT superfamily N-acetyltransferase
MENYISSDIVEKWVKAWSISREVPLPVKFKSGLKVDVGFEKQKTRYVFTELNNDFIQLSKDIDEPWVFLKVCSPPSEIKKHISKKWIIQPQGYMMSCFHPMTIADISLHNNYKLEITNNDSTSVIRIVTQKGEVASTGRIIIVDELAVYDRIVTDVNHQRKGLGTFLMKELEKIALSKGASKNFLVATEEGKSLYETLGWKLYSLFTSIVIPVNL